MQMKSKQTPTDRIANIRARVDRLGTLILEAKTEQSELRAELRALSKDLVEPKPGGRRPRK